MVLAIESESITTVLTGGDDYEILFTAPPAMADELTALSQALDVPITAIVPNEIAVNRDDTGRRSGPAWEATRL